MSHRVAYRRSAIAPGLRFLVAAAILCATTAAVGIGAATVWHAMQLRMPLRETASLVRDDIPRLSVLKIDEAPIVAQPIAPESVAPVAPAAAASRNREIVAAHAEAKLGDVSDQPAAQDVVEVEPEPSNVFGASAEMTDTTVLVPRIVRTTTIVDSKSPVARPIAWHPRKAKAKRKWRKRASARIRQAETETARPAQPETASPLSQLKDALFGTSPRKAGR